MNQADDLDENNNSDDDSVAGSIAPDHDEMDLKKSKKRKYQGIY